MSEPSERALWWLSYTTKIAPEFLRVTPMRGANSSSVYAVENAAKARARGFVLRVFSDAQWLAREPDVPIREGVALQQARFCQVATPRFIAYATPDAGFGAPGVLMTRLTGHVELQPADPSAWSAQLANVLAQIHAHPARDFGWNYFSWIDETTLQVPDWAEQPQLWQRAIEFWRAGPPRENSVFLHRDFHPCNVLWHQGKISGVVDWVNACLGPRGVDVAHCRTNLAVLFGIQVADEFRDRYLAIAGGQHHPYWDVASILEFSLPQPEFYRPWSEFGRDEISAAEMGRRNEVYLQSVLQTAGEF